MISLEYYPSSNNTVATGTCNLQALEPTCFFHLREAGMQHAALLGLLPYLCDLLIGLVKLLCVILLNCLAYFQF
jgi:hypothetical protein